MKTTQDKQVLSTQLTDLSSGMVNSSVIGDDDVTRPLRSLRPMKSMARSKSMRPTRTALKIKRVKISHL